MSIPLRFGNRDEKEGKYERTFGPKKGIGIFILVRHCLLFLRQVEEIEECCAKVMRWIK